MSVGHAMKPMSEAHFAILRHMVEVIGIQVDLAREELGKTALDEGVLAAMRKVPRHRFVASFLAAPISAARFRHSTNSAARLSPAFKRSANRLQRHLPRVPLISCFRPQNCGAVSRRSTRPGQVPTNARLSRFYSKFCLQRDRSTTYAKRAADCKLARLTTSHRHCRSSIGTLGTTVSFR